MLKKINTTEMCKASLIKYKFDNRVMKIISVQQKSFDQ